MNKIITVYELLGLIKDGKAPKKIEYQGNILEFDGKDYKFYKNADVLSEDSLVKYIAVGNLKDKVEILEEDKPIIEKIHLENMHDKESLRFSDYELQDKLNQVIDYINEKEKDN